MRSPTGKGIRSDGAGDGHYGASRGTRKHAGLDFLCNPGQVVVMPVTGELSRVVYPYAGDTTYTGCEILCPKARIYMFYLVPDPDFLNRHLEEGSAIGVAQDISKKYGSPMQPHIHFEFKSIDPEMIFALANLQ